jgi:hypothetical protein
MPTLRQIVQAVEARLSLPIDQVVFGSDSDNALQIAAFVNEAGVALSRAFPWQALLTRVSFAAVATVEQPAVLPAAPGRVLPGTVWNETRQEQLRLGVSVIERSHRLVAAVTPCDAACWVAGRSLHITPPPAAGDVISCMMLSAAWVAGGKTSCTVDDDEPLLDTELLTLSTVARWKLAKGLEAGADVAKYEEAFRVVASGDANPGVRDVTRVAIDGLVGHRDVVVHEE